MPTFWVVVNSWLGYPFSNLASLSDQLVSSEQKVRVWESKKKRMLPPLCPCRLYFAYLKAYLTPENRSYNLFKVVYSADQ